ncbi:MAG TPA: hypothetical protein VNM15_05540 [Candidatus Binatia bacterium]|nr:hypothetical protein [Candidatus Binatia bacterium]
MAFKMLCAIPVTFRFKRRKILIPDVPPPSPRAQQEWVIAGIGLFCATVVVAAVALVFFGA